MNQPIINPAWLQSFAQSNPFIKRIAALAGFQAAIPTRRRDSATRIGTNPNSTYSQMQRVQLQWDGEHIGKNSAFGVAYLRKRKMYCDPVAYIPATGDSVLDVELKAYLDEVWKNGGENCSMFESFGRVANVEQPCKGDGALVWYRDVNQLRLIEVGSDQIGELYQFTRPSTDLDGLVYFAGMYFNPVSGQREGFKIYDRGFNDFYTNPRPFPASDVIYFQDNLFKGIRGITIFHAIIDEIYNSTTLFKHGMANAEKQAKIAVVVQNSTGTADPFSYDTVYNDEGELTYVEKTMDGPAVEFQYRGDGYQLMRTQSPGPELIAGCQYADERSALGLGFPYSFIVNGDKVGGASLRLEINIAGHEIERVQTRNRAKLEIISYITIMDAIQRGKFKAREGITKGTWQFPNLPIADAFREDKADIEAVRAGTKTRGQVCVEVPFAEIVRRKGQEAVMIHRAVAEANAELEAEGLPPTITQMDIAQDTDQPQMLPTAGKPVEKEPPAKAQAAFAAYMGDLTVSELPESTQADIAAILGTNGATGALKVIKYGMTVSELLKMADPDNLEAARKRLRYCTNGACADEVHANTEKHVIVQNQRVVDGHHHLARAEKGKVSKSLHVIDISPARFQVSA